jgi:hypothetical protein
VKLITIGDIHGRTYWKEIDPEKYDRIIFVGDYVDQFPPMTDVEIETNLLEIIELKKKYPEKVVLLLGNHDIQYLFLDEGFGCSGFRPTQARNLQMIFKHNKKLFQIAYQIEWHLWTHAGVSTTWYDYNRKDIDHIHKTFNCKDLADVLNHMLWMKENRLLHQIGKKGQRGGYYPSGGPTWADRMDTKNDYLDGYHQIVGHTPIQTITLFGNEKGSIRYVDVLNEVYFIRERLKNPELEKQFTKFYEFENEHWS